MRAAFWYDASTMEGELSPERMQQEQTLERITRFMEQGLDPKDASRLAELVHAQEHGPLSLAETEERASLMEKIHGKRRVVEP